MKKYLVNNFNENLERQNFEYTQKLHEYMQVQKWNVKKISKYCSEPILKKQESVSKELTLVFE